MCKQRYEIGSNFHLSENEILEIKNFFNANIHDSARIKFLSSGRQAICACLLDIEKHHAVNKKALVPEYTCQSVLAGFLEMGYELAFYQINNKFNLEISRLNSLLREKEPDVLLFHPYFGFDTIIQDEKLDKKSIQVIYDATQSWASDFVYPFSDYKIISLRKWAALPDGAIAEKIKGQFCSLMIESEQKNLVNDTLIAYTLKEKYLKYQIGEKSEMLQAFANIKQTFFDNRFALKTMTTFSKKMFAKITNKLTLDAWHRQRRDNYRTLYNYSNWGKIGDPYFKVLQEVPLFFPLNVKNMERQDFQSYLAKNNVYCPIIWPIPKSVKTGLISPELKEIRNNCLCFPIDQRYSKEDMEYIIKLLDSL